MTHHLISLALAGADIKSSFCRVHFKFKHDAILKQLETWQAADPALKTSCDQIRSAMDQYRTKEGLPIGT